MLRRGVLLITGGLVLCLLAACGYHFGVVDTESSTISVAMFGNQTSEPLVQKDLTNFVISELGRSPTYVPVEDGAGYRLSLEGEVSTYSSSAVAYDAADTIVRYLVRVSADVTLRQEPSGRVLWKGRADSAQEYPADIDKGIQRQLEEQARLMALSRLAEEIVQGLERRF